MFDVILIILSDDPIRTSKKILAQDQHITQEELRMPKIVFEEITNCLPQVVQSDPAGCNECVLPIHCIPRIRKVPNGAAQRSLDLPTFET
jgi:hypothetical protein